MLGANYNANLQILQTGQVVAIRHEMIHGTRLIPLDGRPHLSPRLRQLGGDSRCHWEGSTLVVDTTNFTAMPNFRAPSSLARQDIIAVNQRVQAITVDQKRLRDNLRETPKESPLFARYLKTLEDQEQEMDELSAKLQALHVDEAKTKAAYDDYLAALTAE